MLIPGSSPGAGGKKKKGKIVHFGAAALPGGGAGMSKLSLLLVVSNRTNFWRKDEGN